MGAILISKFGTEMTATSTLGLGVGLQYILAVYLDSESDGAMVGRRRALVATTALAGPRVCTYLGCSLDIASSFRLGSVRHISSQSKTSALGD